MLMELLGVGCAVFMFWSYLLMKRNKNYWKMREIPGPEPHMFFGNFKECYMKQCSYAERVRQLYLESRHSPVFGYFNIMNPVLGINDPSYIEKILKTDFSCFTDRFPSAFAQKHELHRNLFNLNGAQWRAVRNKMAPIFTSLKLKTMTPHMEKCFENTRGYIEENVANGEVDMKEVAAVYSHDVIVQCLFGIESHDLTRPGTRFRRMQTEFFHMTFWKLLYFVFTEQFPRFSAFFNISHFSQRTLCYFRNLVESALDQRSSKRNNRDDLVQVLLKMREKRTLNVYEWDHPDDNEQSKLSVDTLGVRRPVLCIEVTDSLVESQAILFFQTGVESMLASLCFAVFELSRSPQVLTKLREEVDEMSHLLGPALSTKVLNSMPYLDMCIKETLRLYPIVPIISRLCSRKYELPCGITIEPGEAVTVPVVGLHVDPEYFPDPYKFEPERFVVDPPPFTYLPFGEGPRICFAMRFVTTELKVGLFKLVQGYDFTAGQRSTPELAKWTLYMKPSSPVWVRFTPRQHTSSTLIS